MKIVDKNILYSGNVQESILVKSFEEYKSLGGEKSSNELYWAFKDRANNAEQMYLRGMDMVFNKIKVSKDAVYSWKYSAQVYWDLLSMWFNEPKKNVSYSSFIKSVNDICC